MEAVSNPATASRVLAQLRFDGRTVALILVLPCLLLGLIAWMFDGTPVLDIKPYVPYADAIPNANHGWLEEPSECPLILNVACMSAKLTAVIRTRVDFFIAYPDHLLFLHQVRGLMQLSVEAGQDLAEVYDSHLVSLAKLVEPALGVEGSVHARDLVTAESCGFMRVPDVTRRRGRPLQNQTCSAIFAGPPR